MAPNTITLLLAKGQPFQKEGPLGDQTYGDPVTPGMLVEVTTSSVLPLSTASTAPSPVQVAVEMGIDGRGIDTDYTVEGEAVPYEIFQAGEEFYGLIAAGENIAADDILEPDGAGCLQAASGGGGFRALEAVNNSAGSAPVHIRVEVL